MKLHRKVIFANHAPRSPKGEVHAHGITTFFAGGGPTFPRAPKLLCGGARGLGGNLAIFGVGLHMKLTMVILFLFGGIATHSLTAQEVRVHGNMLILGYINNPFIGAGVGIETGLGKHFTLSADANWGSHQNGSSLELRPSVNYYFGMEQKGVFAGIALKYISLSEAEEGDDHWEDNLYSIGFNLGFKAVMHENWTLTFVASPHKTIGGHKEGDVAGISAQLALGYRF